MYHCIVILMWYQSFMHKTIKSIDSFSPEPLFARLFSVVFGTVCVCVCVCVCVLEILSTPNVICCPCVYI